jgi:hypothetical protein
LGGGDDFGFQLRSYFKLGSNTPVSSFRMSSECFFARPGQPLIQAETAPLYRAPAPGGFKKPIDANLALELAGFFQQLVLFVARLNQACPRATIFGCRKKSFAESGYFLFDFAFLYQASFRGRPRFAKPDRHGRQRF